MESASQQEADTITGKKGPSLVHHLLLRLKYDFHVESGWSRPIRDGHVEMYLEKPKKETRDGVVVERERDGF